MSAQQVIARLRDLLRFDTEPFILTREMALVLIEECEQQRTRAEAAETELSELQSQVENEKPGEYE